MVSWELDRPLPVQRQLLLSGKVPMEVKPCLRPALGAQVLADALAKAMVEKFFVGILQPQLLHV